MEKPELRKKIRSIYKASSAEDRARWSEQVCERIYDMPQIKTADTIMAFYPLPDEADIRSLLRHLAGEGKTVLLPEVKDDATMVLRRYSPDGEMIDSLLGTQVPDTSEYDDYSSIEVVLVPGMAFDREGHRMGRGKGYYDRFLTLLPKECIKIGVCLPYQIVEHVPTEEHDIVMDYV